MDEIALLPIVISIPAFVVIAYTIIDVLRRSDLAPVRKAMWIALAVLLPVVGSFLYLFSRPFTDPGHTTVRGNERTTALIDLLVRRHDGEIDDAHFDAAKREIFEAATARD